MLNAKNIKKLVHITLGLLLLVIGLFGLVLPILNGLIPLLLGLILLSFESKHLEKRLDTFARRHPLLDRWYTIMTKKLREFFRVDP